MEKFRGFRLKHRVTTLFRCLFRRKRFPSAYQRLAQPRTHDGVKPISRLFGWCRRLRTKAKSICSGYTDPGYVHIGQEHVGTVPKGHMAVYVGQKDGDYQRILVPVIYFNHPLFGKLLREAEKEYGFNHPGGITIPCRISEFEHVKTRIAAGQSSRKLLTWRRPS